MTEIIVIMELILLILIKVQASDPLQDHNNVHSPLTTCLDTKLESCEEKKKQLLPTGYTSIDGCIIFEFVNCFSKAIPDDPANQLVKECHAFCKSLEDDQRHWFYIYTTCLKICHQHTIKRHH
jgi:hypothetical protein